MNESYAGGVLCRGFASVAGASTGLRSKRWTVGRVPFNPRNDSNMKAAFGITTTALVKIALAMPGCRSKSVFFDEANESHYRAPVTRDTAIERSQSDVDRWLRSGRR